VTLADAVAAGSQTTSSVKEGLVCQGLTKEYGGRRVLDDVSFNAPMGAVTGFVGVNGAGKSTTMRIILGLVKATSGTALLTGKPYAKLTRPRQIVGAVSEHVGAHPGQTGRSFLRALAPMAGVGDSRVTEVLELVDLAEAARRRVGGYSLGMRQRLALGAALLGDPSILIFDEPANGLDPVGIRWTREFVRDLAAEGRCVLMSSHQLGELEATADRIIMIHKGRLLDDADIQDASGGQGQEVTVRTPRREQLAALVEAAGGTTRATGEHDLVVRGLSVQRIGELAAGEGVVLYSLGESRSRLEEIFLELSGAEAAAGPSKVRQGGGS
jgi:ABC-2 type transport system ATP-binding protein